MKTKRVISALLIAGGIALLLVTKYIMNQVAQGEEQIASGESKLGTAKSLFSLNPTAKMVGEGLTSGSEEKISQGKEQIAYYTMVANRLQVSGYVLIAVGVGFFFLFGIQRKR